MQPPRDHSGGLTVCMLLLALLFATWVIFALPDVFTRADRGECEKLGRQADEYGKQFFITQSQDSMCRSLGIVINTRVQ